MTGCIFCDIIAGDAPADVFHRDDDIVIFRPLKPYAPGHVLVVPTLHVTDALPYLQITAQTFAAAAEYARLHRASNILTSVGAQATQTVMHLHVHVIPRSPIDGLHHDWPWCREEETT